MASLLISSCDELHYKHDLLNCLRVFNVMVSV